MRSFFREASGIFLLALLAVLTGISCFSHRRGPYAPERPYVGPDGISFTPARSGEPFPERSLALIRGEDSASTVLPALTLLRIESVIREIGTMTRPEPEWRLRPVRAEIAACEKELDRLDIGPGLLLREQLGTLRDEDRAVLRKASGLILRIGVALMRTGEVNQRVWGAEKIRQAIAWDPENPIPVLILSGYDQIAGFFSQDLDLLNRFVGLHGHNDLVDLQILRRRERLYKVHREGLDLERAQAECRGLAARKGGWNRAPAWLDLERARLCFLADSADTAVRSAEAALRKIRAGSVPGTGAGHDPGTGAGRDPGSGTGREPGTGGRQPGTAGRDPGPADTLSAVQARILLGVMDVRGLRYDRAEAHFDTAMAMAARFLPLRSVASVMSVPWDLWTKEDRRAFDASADRAGFVQAFWHANDPIRATPSLDESRIEYERRVGEAWFALFGVDPATPALLTDPGQAILRFGVPTEWTSETDMPVDRMRNVLGPRTIWRMTFGEASGRSGSAGVSGSAASGIAPAERRTAAPEGADRAAEGASGTGSAGDERTGSTPAGNTGTGRTGTAGGAGISGTGIGGTEIGSAGLTAGSAADFAPLNVYFADRGQVRFLATDSLRGSGYPPFTFEDFFRGRRTRLNARVARFRTPAGGTRLVYYAETYLPDYTVRYPLRGFRFEGEAGIHLALFRMVRQQWRALEQKDILLDRETEVVREHRLRRRAALLSLGEYDGGMFSVASLLSLQDGKGRIVAMAQDNGEPVPLEAEKPEGLAASDLVLLSPSEDIFPPEEEREIAPGVTVHGPDLESVPYPPRAGRLLLPGEDLAFYLEVYNLSWRHDVTEAELILGLERLREDGTADYAVALRGTSQTLIRYRVKQWNLARTIGLTDLEPGVYRLRIIVVDRHNDERIQRVAEFRVVPLSELIDVYGWRTMARPEGD